MESPINEDEMDVEDGPQTCESPFDSLEATKHESKILDEHDVKTEKNEEENPIDEKVFKEEDEEKSAEVDTKKKKKGSKGVGRPSQFTALEKIQMYKALVLNKAAKEGCFSSFNLKLAKEVKELKAGMKLEALDRNNPCNYCIATVISVSGHRVLIRYDGFGKDSSHDFWCDFQADELFPIGFCASNNYPLQPPTGIKSSLEEWKTFLTKTLTGALAAPVELFREPLHRKPRRVHSFQVGMTVECVHPKMPSIVCIGVISKSLGPYYYLITTDACDEAPSVSFCCHNDSPLVFPIGWCKTHNFPLTLSSTAKAKGLTVDQYVSVCSAKAAPPTALYKLSRMSPFRITQKVEAVDMEQPSIIRVATVHNLYGRVVELMFDGLAKYQLTDLECQSLYPIGWCAETGHPLHTPHGIMCIRSAFSLPSRNVRSPPRTGKPLQKKQTTQKKLTTPEPLKSEDVNSPLFTMPSFRSIVERPRSLESKVYFNKTCYFGEMLDPVKVMEASRCTMPSKPAVVLRRTLERLLCVSKSPDELAQVIQDGLDVKIIVRGKVVRKNLSQYDNRPCAVQFLKLLCQRLECCEYFLSFDAQYMNDCPLKCKKNAVSPLYVPPSIGSPPIVNRVRIKDTAVRSSIPVSSTPQSIPLVVAQEKTLALHASQRPILPSNLQPSFTVARGHPSSFPLPISAISTSHNNRSTDSTSSPVVPSPTTQPSNASSRLLIDSPGTKLVANLIRSSIQNGKLGSPTTIKTSEIPNSSVPVTGTGARTTTSKDSGLQTVFIVHTAPSTMSPSASVAPAETHLSTTLDPQRHLQGTLLLNHVSDLPTSVNSMQASSSITSKAADSSPVSLPSTLLIPKNSIIQMGDGTSMNAGKLLLQPVHFPSRGGAAGGTASLTLPIQDSQATVIRPSFAVTTCMSSPGAVTNSVMTQIEARSSIPQFQCESIPTIKFNARNHHLPAGRFSVISTQHSQTRRAVAVVPPANGVVRSPVQGVATLKSPHPIAPGAVGPVIRGPTILCSTAGSPSMASPTQQIPGIKRTLGFTPSTIVSAGYVVSKQVVNPSSNSEPVPSSINNSDQLRSPSFDGLSATQRKKQSDFGTKPDDISSPSSSVSVAYVSLQSNSKDKIMYVPLRPGTAINQQLLLYHPNSTNQSVNGGNTAEAVVPLPVSLPQTYYGGKILPTSTMTSFRIQGQLVNGIPSSAHNGVAEKHLQSLVVATDRRTKPPLILPRQPNDECDAKQSVHSILPHDNIRQRKRRGSNRQLSRKKKEANSYDSEEEYFSGAFDDDDDDDGDLEYLPRKGLKQRILDGNGSCDARHQPIRIEPADRRVRQATFLTDPLSRVQLPNNPEDWTPDDVAKFIEATDCPLHADNFRSQEIDGRALLLLTREALMDFAGFKLGPALKVCSYIAQLKTRIKQSKNGD